MIGLACEICGERFDVAVQEGPSRDIEALVEGLYV